MFSKMVDGNTALKEVHGGGAAMFSSNERPDASSGEGLSREVLDLLDRLGRLMDRFRQEQSDACGLRLPVWNLLHILESAGTTGMTVSEAARHLGVRPQALSGPANEMVEEGLLLRNVDGRDARARRMTISDSGRQRLLLGAKLNDKVRQQILEKVPQASVARLVMSRLAQALESGLPREEEAEADQ